MKFILTGNIIPAHLNFLLELLSPENYTLDEKSTQLEINTPDCTEITLQRIRAYFKNNTQVTLQIEGADQVIQTPINMI